MPGVAALETLAATVTGAGLPTRIVVSGRARSLPPAVDQAVYRIAHGALTDALGRAGRATAVVIVSYERDRLLLEVLDDGRGAGRSAGDPAPGHDVHGMRDGALALGGELDAGARPLGGFRVRAALPVVPAPPLVATDSS
jgi:signal transduction histidine kinase